MTPYRFLKKINDTEYHEPEKIDLDDPSNLLLKKLKKRDLVDYDPICLNNGHPGVPYYKITKKGMEYVEEHQENRRHFIVNTIVGAIISVTTGVLISIILLYLFHIH